MIGQTLGKRYRVERLLGKGKFAAVYAAVDKKNQPRAVKVFRSVDVEQVTVGKRFFQRARLFKRSPHPALLPILDSGRTEEGVPFLVMELLEGRSLEREIAAVGPPRLPRALHIMGTVLDGLAAAHDKGNVHRNINTANIFLVDSEGAQQPIRILDMGVARDLVDYLTLTPSAMGSTSYLAPELLLDFDNAWGPGVDVFASGMVLFEMLTGRLPFDKALYVGPLEKTINAYRSISTLPAASELAPHLPRELDDFLARALSIDQEERYSNARVMLDAFLVLKMSLHRVEHEYGGPPQARSGASDTTSSEVVGHWGSEKPKKSSRPFTPGSRPPPAQSESRPPKRFVPASRPPLPLRSVAEDVRPTVPESFDRSGDPNAALPTLTEPASRRESPRITRPTLPEPTSREESPRTTRPTLPESTSHTVAPSLTRAPAPVETVNYVTPDHHHLEEGDTIRDGPPASLLAELDEETSVTAQAHRAQAPAEPLAIPGYSTGRSVVDAPDLPTQILPSRSEATPKASDAPTQILPSPQSGTDSGGTVRWPESDGREALLPGKGPPAHDIENMSEGVNLEMTQILPACDETIEWIDDDEDDGAHED